MAAMRTEAHADAMPSLSTLQDLLDLIRVAAESGDTSAACLLSIVSTWEALLRVCERQAIHG